MTRHAALAVFLVLAFPAWAASPVGGWWTEGRNGQVTIEGCGDRLCGKLAALKEPLNAEGQPKRDRHNPDPALRDRPLIGLPLLQGFVPEADEANKWSSGTIYDPESGKTYKCTLTLRDDGSLEVRGYIGLPLLGRSQTWQPVK